MFKWRSSLAHHMKTRHKTVGGSSSTAARKVVATPIPDIRGVTHALRGVRYAANGSPGSSSRDSSKDYRNESDRHMLHEVNGKRTSDPPRQSPTTVNHHHGIVQGLERQPHRDQVYHGSQARCDR
jgi:hypothetical protein